MAVNKILDAVKKHNYVVASRMGNTDIVIYAGDSAVTFKDMIKKNMCIKLECYKNKKPIHKEKVLLDE